MHSPHTPHGRISSEEKLRKVSPFAFADVCTIYVCLNVGFVCDESNVKQSGKHKLSIVGFAVLPVFLDAETGQQPASKGSVSAFPKLACDVESSVHVVCRRATRH